MKIAALLLVSCLALAASAQDPSSWTKPWFCHRNDCPVYNVTSSDPHAGVEMRQYAAARWLSTNITGEVFDRAISTGFHRLFDYISGQNVDAIKVDMTSPGTIPIVLPLVTSLCFPSLSLS
eukprot:TRINITY_DN3912_c0_g1_i2.p2 TRINITY_DN3912_c0_g1~~TRINITY_DN3912_c0_g1_i2.p2  ORF type:complete len:140 (-),score=36.50 TRINITY_DN3912_c0_g1_i2:15-377(-)